MHKKRNQYISVIVILGAFLLILAALMGRYGWIMNLTAQSDLAILDDSDFPRVSGAEDTGGEEVLYLWDSRDDNSAAFYDEMTRILKDMKADYTETDLGMGVIPDLSSYKIVVLGFTDYQNNEESVLNAVEWMENGGRLFVPQVPERGSVYEWVSGRIGVMTSAAGYYPVTEIHVSEDFMLAGNTLNYRIPASGGTALPVELNKESKVYVTSAEQNGFPVLWKTLSGEGCAVVVNLGYYGKMYRGIYAMAYSLLADTSIWPVINSSAFYLDGFPFPLSEEKNGYITAVYGGDMDMYTFYVRRWWNDLIALAGKYGIRYTGTILENSDNNTVPPYKEQSSSRRYQYFISTLLEMGGELGLNGYNQQPLFLEMESIVKTDRELTEYEEALQTNRWRSTSDMESALKEAVRFQKSILKETDMQVYTPPGNIISEEGIHALKNGAPEIRTIAGNYYDNGDIGGTEFEIDESGMIMTPRITSGFIRNDYQKLCALSELNMHYIISHSVTPADVINPDAGAELGWPVLLENLEEYEEWVQSAAPDIKHRTGSETAAAVQRFYYADIHSERLDNGLKLKVDNFQDEAWFMIRFNEWEPDIEKTEGGTLTRLTGNLYLLRVESENVSIVRKDIR